MASWRRWKNLLQFRRTLTVKWVSVEQCRLSRVFHALVLSTFFHNTWWSSTHAKRYHDWLKTGVNGEIIQWHVNLLMKKMTDDDDDDDVRFCSLAVLDLRVGHTMDILSPFISVLCHSNWLFHVRSYPRLDVVHPGRAWSSSPSCTWHCSLHYLFLQATPLFSQAHGVTIVC